ncbi:hypothetical protein [Rhizobium sp. Leaf341]|uniref:hypothetical protein n=1 Tax=Rhizobium sp. Leaf341 TaxID=1736344 RepID=UPI0007131020|nr:hypothetical protein [Rhizobium sp. Leaf341]KQR67871.1 hypothetical protein ASG03_10145 [Rhizobium sp. Leaf341]
MLVLILRHWPKIVAVLAVILTVWAIYAKGVSDTKSAQAVEDLRVEKALRETEKAAYVADAERADAAYNRLRALNSKVEGLNDYVRINPTSGNQCLDGADTDQLRDLWK